MRQLGDVAISAVIGQLGGDPDGKFDHMAAGLNNAIRDSVSSFRAAARTWLSADGVDSRQKIGMDYLAQGLTVCESPIERVLLPWMVFSDWNPIAAPPIPVHIPDGDKPFPRTSLVIVPQLKFANARFDFALFVRDIGVRRIIAVECDGRDFHDVRKDMARDAYFSGRGIQTVRLTGSDLTKNPARCAHDVFAAVAETYNASVIAT